MKLFTALLVSSLIWVVTATGYAQDSTQYGRTGFYGGANGVFSVERFRDTNGLSFENSNGFNVRAGYRLEPLIALEVEFERNSRFALQNAPTVGLETFAGTLNVKLFPIQLAIQPYLLLGTGFLHARADGAGITRTDTGSIYRGGVGLDLYTTANWVVNLEGAYVFPQGEVDGLDYISLSSGLQYRF